MYQTPILFSILITMIILFIWGYWRYDLVAFLALIISVLFGIVPMDQAFSGFSNPAVVTVGCIMIISAAISQSGVLDYLIVRLEFLFESLFVHIALLTVISAILSAFMNNVGALGLMMPIAIQTFLKNKRSPSIILMPIAFGSVLGGMITAIGTPPNLLISSYRQEMVGHSFNIFDFTPVGLLVALAGVSFIIILGWRLIPVRRKASNDEDLFKMSDYMAEVRVTEKSPLIEKSIKEMKEILKANVELIAIVQNGVKKFSFSKKAIINKNDILIIEVSSDELEKILKTGKLELAGDKPISSSAFSNDEITIMEAVVPPDSDMEGNSARMLKLRLRFGINLLALSRKGMSFRQKLNDIRFLAGDVVLLQGNVETLREIIVNLGFLPLAERNIAARLTKQSFFPFVVFVLSILLAAFQIFSIEVSFSIAVLLMVMFKVIPLHKIYHSIDWSVLLLLAAIIPIGEAMKTTGAADLISSLFIQVGVHFSPVYALAAILIVTMTLSDLMNNVATAVVLAPIAAQLAKNLHVSIDPFLMAVAIGASCSFLTPIAHQNNTMVMGPGGYKFFDYARLGLPLEIIIIIVAVPAIIWVWPL